MQNALIFFLSLLNHQMSPPTQDSRRDFFMLDGFALDLSLGQEWLRKGRRWSELTQKKPVHSNFEEIRVVCVRKHRRRQRVPLLRCLHFKRRLETLSANWWYSNKVRTVGMVVCRASRCAMIEGGWWDEVVEFLGTLSEVQSVEERQANKKYILSFCLTNILN